MKFTYWGTEYVGFDAEYNDTIHNERAVEIAVALPWFWLHDLAVTGGLEVGNVLGHYGVKGHRVVDLYEYASGVENVDVFDIEGRYPWIVSISTLEHVYWDTEPREEYAAPKALEHLKSLLAPGGAMLVTVPGGWHQTFDDYLMLGVGATRACTMVRSGGTWQQTPDPIFLPYGPHANSVWIGEWCGT